MPRGELEWGVAASIGLLAAATGFRALRPVAQPPFDFAPLFLGAHALARGLDPGDRDVHRALWEELGSGRAPGAFFNPYPATASAMIQPFFLGTPWADVASPLHLAMTACVALGCATVLFLPGPSRSARAAAAGLALFAAVRLDAVRHGIELGQVTPAVLLLTLLAATSFAVGRDALGAGALAAGACLKLFPLVLLPVVWQRPRMAAGFVVSALAACAAVWWMYPAWQPEHDLGRAWLQVSVGQLRPPPGTTPLWAWRGVAAAVVLVPLVVALARRPSCARTRAAAAGLCLCFGAVAAGGLAPPHEAAFVLPALVFAIGWLATDGWRPAPALAAACLAVLPSTSLDRYPAHDVGSQDHALWMILAVVSVGCARALGLLKDDTAGSPSRSG